MMPSAPMATAARAAAGTRLRRPVACEGSTTTGKWQSSLQSATPARSSVFLNSASNVLIPRSHKMTLGFPPDSKYSAASSHSLIVAEGPRFEQHRPRHRGEPPQQR